MKALFDLMQKWTLEIVVLFALSPRLPVIFQKTMGTENDDAAYATWAMLVVSTLVFGLVVWWICSGWFTQRPWRLSALVFASAIGVMTSASALLGMYAVIGPDLYLTLRGLPSLIFAGAALALWFIDWQDTKKFGENNRTS